MPELPEVDIVKQGLAPFLTGALIKRVILNRNGLRFPFAANFAQRLSGQKVTHVGRRAKYLLFTLSSGDVLLSHLGMTGNFRFAQPDPQTAEINAGFQKHDHVVFELSGTDAPAPFLVYSDPRRFGFMELVEDIETCKFLVGLGPEPLGNALTAASLAEQLHRRKAPIKAALLDQHTIAGLGNIYVCEALHRAAIDPRTRSCDLLLEPGTPGPALESLVIQIRRVLNEALEAGGSTLQDYRNVDGNSGYFQHRFFVYDREGEPCLSDGCKGTITRIVQSGRSSFFCPQCQNT